MPVFPARVRVTQGRVSVLVIIADPVTGSPQSRHKMKLLVFSLKRSKVAFGHSGWIDHSYVQRSQSLTHINKEFSQYRKLMWGHSEQRLSGTWISCFKNSSTVTAILIFSSISLCTSNIDTKYPDLEVASWLWPSFMIKGKPLIKSQGK